MNDDDLNDSAVLSAVRDSISGLPMPAAPRLEAITARGRARRRRRLGGLSIAGAGAGACAALVVGLAGGWGPAGPAPSSAGPAPHRQAPAVHLAAFSVVAGPDGATTLTLYPGEVADPNLVRQALADHGIPALVTADKFCRTADQFCRTADQPSPGVGQVVVLPHRPQQRISGPARRGPAGPARS